MNNCEASVCPNVSKNISGAKPGLVSFHALPVRRATISIESCGGDRQRRAKRSSTWLGAALVGKPPSSFQWRWIRIAEHAAAGPADIAAPRSQPRFRCKSERGYGAEPVSGAAPTRSNGAGSVSRSVLRLVLWT